jgi:eukaryotic-like serine/threonine-protein kinase
MPEEGKDTTFPSQFGRYTLVQRLATGGMAEVFKAKILSGHGFEKLLVIKRILPNLAADKTFVSMFIDEAKLTAQLVHPKIVQVTDFGEVNGQYFIALEFVDGFDGLALLRAASQKQVSLPAPICMFIAMEVLDALDYAHNAKDVEGKPMHLVHRDISPSNVFIAQRGDVKLGDFGIAHAQERESKTQAGTLKGKYGYMSPEQVTGAVLDGRSDLFAVAIVLAEMLMCKRLFTAQNDLDVLLMVRDGRLDRFDKYAKDIPQALETIVRRGLAKNPDERFQTAAEFRDSLHDLEFQFGLRVGPSDVGLLASDLFDKSPEAMERLKEHSHRWEIKSDDASVRRRGAGFKPDQVVARKGAGDESEDTSIPIDIDGQDSGSPDGAESSPAATVVVAALDDALAKSMSLVELDQYSTPAAVPAPGWTPASVDHLTGGLGAPSPWEGTTPIPDASSYRGTGASGLRPSLGRPASGENQASPAAGAVLASTPSGERSLSPDNTGDLSLTSTMRVIADLAVMAETGLVRFARGSRVKDVYLVRGAPESVNSNMSGDRFGEYLVTRGFLRLSDLERALAEMPRFSGKLGEALVGLGFMRPLDVFRLLSQQVRERVMELFTWTEGEFSLFRGLQNPVAAFPLGLNSFEILGAGVLALSYDFLAGRFAPLAGFRPRAMPNPRINPEAFRLGPTPREVWGLLDGSRTLAEWTERFGSSDELLTFYRTLHLLVETSLAQFE